MPLTWAQVLEGFKGTYPQGSRRVPTGLPRLCGILHSRGVPLSQALDFLQRWQITHFRPPLEGDDLEAQVHDMYARWGPVLDVPGIHPVLVALSRSLASDSLPRGNNRDAGQDSPAGSPVCSQGQSARRRALVEARMTALFGLRRAYAADWALRTYTPLTKGV